MYEEDEIGNLDFSKSIWQFFGLFLVVCAVLGGILFLGYSRLTDFGGGVYQRERDGVHVRAEMLRKTIGAVLGDLDYLSKQEELIRYVRSGDKSLLPGLARDYLSFSRSRMLYDQIRLFDRRGMELVRVNYNEGIPSIVAKDELQYKGGRYYFTDTMVLSRGGIFVSPLDLNIEKGKVEVPFKPVIRLGVPLYGDGESPVGALIINYRAIELLNILRDTGRLSEGQTMLLNANGYWLLAPNSTDLWGFMFQDKSNVTFGSRFPAEWAELHSNESGQILSGRKIFTYDTIYPLNTDKRIRSSSGTGAPTGRSSALFGGNKYYWKIVSYVPDALMLGQAGWSALKVVMVGSLAMLMAGGGAWLFGYLCIRGRLRRSVRYSAPVRDEVTGLANEKLFDDRAEQAVERMEESGSIAVMRVVVDELESINEAYGDEVGDGLLLQIALRLKCNVAPSDTVARVGRAEFALLRGRVHSAEELEELLSDMRSVLGKPYRLFESQVVLTFVVQGGLCPSDASTPSAMLSLLRK